jgi:hypothetical protein
VLTQVHHFIRHEDVLDDDAARLKVAKGDAAPTLRAHAAAMSSCADAEERSVVAHEAAGSRSISPVACAK